jgi:hypothetical protein
LSSNSKKENGRLLLRRGLVYVLVKYDKILGNNIIMRIPRLTVLDLRGPIRLKLIDDIYASETASCLSCGIMGISQPFYQNKRQNRGLSPFRSLMWLWMNCDEIMAYESVPALPGQTR